MAIGYEKTVCPTCKGATTNIDLILAKAEEEVLFPLGLELYDFGGGNFVVPTPDFDGSGYLTSHMVAVTEGKGIKITGVKLNYFDLSDEILIASLKRAAEAFNKQNTKWAIIP